MMQTTRLYFGERFRFEFSPADTRTPQLGKRERDPSGNHHFDYFVRAVSDHLQKKGIPADTRKGGSYFELLLNGKKDRTADHQERIYRECKEEATETAAQDVWQRFFIPRLSSLENAAKSEADPCDSVREANAEDIEILMEMYRKSQEGKPQPKPWDISAELDTLRDIRKQVEQEGLSALFSEPVLKKLAGNRRIPIKPLDVLIQEETDFFTRLRAEEELCEPEKYPIALDYRLCPPGKPGSVQVGDEHFEFPNLPLIAQMIKRCLPSASHEPPGLNAHLHGNQSLPPDGKGEQAYTVVDVSDLLRQRKGAERAQPVAPGTPAKILGGASMFRKRS
jgi:hypothetical protein